MTDGAGEVSSEPARPGRIALVLFLVGTALLTLANGTFMLLVGPAVAAHGHTEAVIGAIVATGGVTSLLLRVPAGSAFRSGRAALLVLGGSVIAGTGYGLLPLASAAFPLAMLSALQGAGFAVATTAGMAGLIDRRPGDVGAGALMGWYTGSIGAGYALAGFVGGPLADAVGIGGALVAAAGMAVGSGWVTAGALGRLPLHRAHAEEEPSPPRGFVRGVPPGVWVGFAVAFYINLVNGAMNAFFPLYALGIGLSLSQIGVLSGIHGGLASVVRFGAGTLLARTTDRVVVGTLVPAIGLGVAAVAVPRGFLPLAALWATVGLARGVLRVASGAMVMEAAGPSARHRGRASGIYLAGLDLGNVVGPLLGGLASEVVGLRGSFPLIGLVPAVPFLAVAAIVSRGRRSRESSRANLY